MKATFAQNIKSLIQQLPDLIYPRFCISCDTYISQSNHRYICKRCSDDIEYAWRQRCAFCGAQTVDGKTCVFCKQEHALDQLIHAVDFEEPIIKNAIHAFKYEFINQITDDLAPHLNHAYAKYLKETVSAAQTLVMPIPLHWTRKNWRGYNQAELLARALCKTSDLNLETTALKRSFQWDHQAEMQSREERIQNAKNSFYIDHEAVKSTNIENKTVILIDDVATTGATLDEAATTLKSAGARRVIALVLARG